MEQMRKIERLNSKSERNKSLKFLYARIAYYETFLSHDKKYSEIIDTEIDKLIEQAKVWLSELEIRELLAYLGYPINKENELNLSIEALLLCTS